MANGPVEVIVPGGGGPGKEFAKLSKHVLPLGLYLSVLTLILLGLLIWQWPHCETESCKAGIQVQPGSESVAPGSGATPPAAAASATSSSATSTSAPAEPTAGAATAPVSVPSTASSPAPRSLAVGQSGANRVEVFSVDPAGGTLWGGTTVRITGSGFSQGVRPEVLFGGLAAGGVNLESDAALTATTPMHSEGTVDVRVKVKEKDATLTKGFNYICPDRTQARLLFLVVVAGALGGVLHAGRSLFSFVGNRNLRVSWLWMYYLLPLNGAVIGSLFFLVMLAGLFSVQGNSAQSFYLTIGVAAIVGIFSQQAVEKLKQISEAILTKVPPSADQKPKPLALTAVTPSQGPTAGGTPVFLTGSGFAPGATVTFGDAAATGVQVTSERIDAVTPPHAAGKVDVVVCNPDSGMVKKTAAFDYLDGGALLPPGTHQGPAAGGPVPPVGGPGPAAVAPGAAGAGPVPAAGGPGAVAAGPVPAGGGPGAIAAGPAVTAGGPAPAAGGPVPASGVAAPAAPAAGAAAGAAAGSGGPAGTGGEKLGGAAGPREV